MCSDGEEDIDERGGTADVERELNRIEGEMVRKAIE